MLAEKPSGVYAALITPFENENLDLNALRALVESLAERGLNGVVVAGTTGEFPYLSHDERVTLYEAAIDVSRGIKFVAGTGAPTSMEAISLTKVSQDLGYDAVLVCPPYYLAPSDKGTYRYYIELLENTDIPVILYNIPQCTGAYLSRRVIEDLVDYSQVVALKDSSGNLPYLMEVMASVGDQINILVGHDEIVYPALASGAKGMILASANVIPELWKEMFDAIMENNFVEAREIQLKIQKLVRLIVRNGGPLAVRACLKAMGFKVGKSRLPLKSGGSLSWEIRSELVAELGKLGLVSFEAAEPTEPQLETLEITSTNIEKYGLKVGYGRAGESLYRVAIAIVFGSKNGWFAEKWAETFTRLKPGWEALLVVLEPNLMAKPPTLLLPTQEIRDFRHASLLNGPIQSAVGRALAWALESKLLSWDEVEETIALAQASFNPVATNRLKLYRNAYSAAVEAIKKALGGA